MTVDAEPNSFNVDTFDPEGLINENFVEWYTLLAGYANHLLKKNKINGQLGGLPWKAEEGQDIALRVFEKVCSGQRKWDKEKHPDFLLALHGMVRSEVYALRTSAPNTGRNIGFFTETGNISGAVESALSSKTPTPEETLQIKRMNAISAEVISRLKSQISNEKDLKDYLDLFLDGCEPAEIRALMEKSSSEIIALKKRIERLVEKLVEDCSGISKTKKLEA